MRIRHPAALKGTPIGVREAARKYGVPPKTVSEWASREEVVVLARPAARGQPLTLDESSLQKRIAAYNPHRDSTARRLRVRPAGGVPPGTGRRPPTPGVAQGNGHSQPNAGVQVLAGLRIATRTLAPPVRALQSAPTFEEFLARKKGGRRHKATIATLRSYLKTFVADFPVLPWERKVLMDWVLSRPGAPRTIRNYFENIRTFYQWVGKEYDVDIPQMDGDELPTNTAKPHDLTQDQIARVLWACRTPTERAVVIALAQTTARRGELVTITRQGMANNECEVTGKEGPRPLFIPDEAYNALLFAMGDHDRLWPERAPLTATGLSKMMHALFMRAGLYQRGLGNHAFRHSYSAEYKRNGGDSLYLDIIMGHVKKKDMTLHYFHGPAEAKKEAMRCAPRAFLQIAMDLSPQEVAV